MLRYFFCLLTLLMAGLFNPAPGIAKNHEKIIIEPKHSAITLSVKNKQERHCCDSLQIHASNLVLSYGKNWDIRRTGENLIFFGHKNWSGKGWYFDVEKEKLVSGPSKDEAHRSDNSAPQVSHSIRKFKKHNNFSFSFDKTYYELDLKNLTCRFFIGEKLAADESSFVLRRISEKSYHLRHVSWNAFYIRIDLTQRKTFFSRGEFGEYTADYKPIRADIFRHDFYFSNRLAKKEKEPESSPMDLPVSKDRFEVVPATGHSGPIKDIDLTTDGKYLVTASWDGTLRYWDMESAQEKRRIPAARAKYYGVAVSPSDNFLLASEREGPARLLDFHTGRMLKTFGDKNEQIWTVEFTDDEKYALTGGPHTSLKMWEIKSGKLFRSFGWDKLDVGVFVPLNNGHYLLTAGCDGKFRLWDVHSGEAVHIFPGYPGCISDLEVSRDGTYVLATDEKEKTLKIIKPFDGKVTTLEKRHKNQLMAVATHSEGHYASTLDFAGILQFWDIPAGRAIGFPVSLPDDGAEDLLFSADGNTLVAADHMQVLRITTEKKKFETIPAHIPDDVWSMALSSDGRYLVSGYTSGTVSLWSIKTGELIWERSTDLGTILSVTISNDGRYALCGTLEGTILALRMQDGEIIKNFQGHTSRVFDLEFLDERFNFVSVGYDGKMKIWDFENEKDIFVLDDGYSIDRVKKIDDHKIIFYTRSKSVKILSNDNHSIEWEYAPERGVINDCFFLHENLFMTSGPAFGGDATFDGFAMRIHRPGNMSPEETIKGHDNGISAAAISHDGKMLISGDHSGKIQLTAFPGQDRRWVAQVHGNSIRSLLFTPDDRFILSGSEDGSIRILRSSDGRPLLGIYRYGDGNWLSIAPNGYFVASPEGSRNVLLKKGTELRAPGPKQRDRLNRPDIVRSILKTGSVKKDSRTSPSSTSPEPSR